MGRGPRARGAGPGLEDLVSLGGVWSPRTRGWTHRYEDPPPPPQVVPAHAGLDPRPQITRLSARRGPRARGAGPKCVAWLKAMSGWSPRTRGCYHAPDQGRRLVTVVPAHAGLFPPSGHRLERLARGPRARGAVPPGGSEYEEQTCVVPVHAGLFPRPGRTAAPERSGPRARETFVLPCPEPCGFVKGVRPVRTTESRTSPTGEQRPAGGVLALHLFSLASSSKAVAYSSAVGVAKALLSVSPYALKSSADGH